ncbi:MAG TPA: HD-GYP domain-containing protein [Acidimicrobiales bacterium]|nr:HD-GYP domain-containing protein [Acidimicrobiales bacterium]
MTTGLARLLPALEGALAIYDRATAQHSARVSHLAGVIAQELGLPGDEVEVVSYAGMLHDLGKLGIEPEVLQKAGPLNDDEWADIYGHPSVGSELVLAVSADLVPVAEAIRAHHERWDGTGYPDQLGGHDIPIGGRIVAVADAFDAMTHPCTYRFGRFSPNEAEEEVRRQAGRHFDPLVVGAFCALKDQRGEDDESAPVMARVYSALFNPHTSEVPVTRAL